MSSIVDPQPDPPTNEELVAYLDGELPPAECRRVEDRLAADDEYRQELRDLDQAWEALSALPPTTVDDNFARTTIELACVVAEEDISQRAARVTAETRGRKRWWIAAGVVAAVMGFIMVRGLAAHRENAQLADLPAITEVNILTHIPNVEFLRRLSTADFVNELARDEPALERDVANFKSASSTPLSARREWLDDMPAEQKANLADRARTFDDLREIPQEKDRLRRLTNDIDHSPDAAALQKTLIAYGQWLSRHTPAEKEQLREEIIGRPANEQVDTINKMVRHDNEEDARHLSPEDAKIFRGEILKFAGQQKTKLLNETSPGREYDRIAKQNPESPGQVLGVLLATMRNRNDENRLAVYSELVSKLSPDANAQWKKFERRPDLQKRQLWQWVYDALHPEYTPEKLDNFFADSDKLTITDHQRLLDLPRAKMEAELKHIYFSSELGIDDRTQFLRDFGDGGRGPRGGGQGVGRPDGGSPNGNRPGDGPPFDRRFGPDGPRLDRNRPGGPDGGRGPRGDDRGNGHPRRPQNDRPQPQDSPPHDQPPAQDQKHEAI